MRPRRRRLLRWLGRTSLALVAMAGAAALLCLAGGLRYRELSQVALPDGTLLRAWAPAGRGTSPAQLERRIASEAPPGLYLAIDTVANRLYLKRGAEVILTAPCSTGTGGVLTDPVSGRRWVFDTPRGSYKVRGKTREPIWNKPDWAFIEEGLPIPEDPAERRDDFSLGSYALNLGDGYLIHGTLYQRLIGRSITHGCVRLGDADLERVFNAVEIGTSVFIY